MKVGILTFPNSTSYGAVLQMYALYHTVEALGHAPEVINYHNAYMKAERHVSKQSWVRTMAQHLLHYRQYRKFHSFEKRHMVRYPSTAFSDPAKLPELAKRYCAIICGSDQVWNPDITGADLSYFLNFCDKQTNRVAYAPSFGLSDFSSDFSNAIREDLKKFHALSVRETPGQKVVEELTERDVPLVCDPTFLVNAEEWHALEREHPAAKEPYILYYTIRSSASLWKQCRAFAGKTGLKIVVVGGNPLKKWKNRDSRVTYAVDIGPEEWLYLVHHARYVVTNSFHGTAFSVNYRKDFYVEFSSLTKSRLTQITQALGLCAQVTGEKPLNGEPVDYSTADRVLPLMREASMDYLSNALK